MISFQESITMLTERLKDIVGQPRKVDLDYIAHTCNIQYSDDLRTAFKKIATKLEGKDVSK